MIDQGWTRQPLSSKYRAELCDAYGKQLMTSYQRKESKLDWLKKFCTQVRHLDDIRFTLFPNLLLCKTVGRRSRV